MFDSYFSWNFLVESSIGLGRSNVIVCDDSDVIVYGSEVVYERVFVEPALRDKPSRPCINDVRKVTQKLSVHEEDLESASMP